ncbi:myb-like protein P [Drosophila busckii]|uniref:myb-like protein P n=1 Tax=Drosophila busckii TaxID=30019 RepID=UPI00083F0D00|nr:myb-like protein P [Drosophila busckii]XP_017842217.1 myb-like protein P [Drosophila busckii]XP_017842218.1 myb-like protein P [Drosophila busckii]
MDILDIDEALKDDSYIFLADKTHDDISNILQQWKTNNQAQQSQAQSQQQQQKLHLQYNNEQAYKLNSKTFTRPKRRPQAATNLDTQFAHISQNNATPMLSLEIGGLVTNMHKSFLQDTSPPSSICSSITNERMNNSLISSADFTNLNFLQSTNSLEPTCAEFNLTTTATLTGDSYSLSDMIRDRKALESLTMSGDGTLIKDSQIGQIDEISLTMLSKTASGCSTMDNSTESMLTPQEQQILPSTVPEQQQQLQLKLGNTMMLGEEMIGDTTFSLVDSLTTPTTESVSEADPEPAFNATFKRPAALLNETQLLVGRQVNTTFTEGCETPEAGRCETPENVDKKLACMLMESTPLTTTSARLPQFNNNNNNNNNNNTNNNNKHSYTPTLKGRDEAINLSPIVGTITPQRSLHNQRKQQQQLNNTYEKPEAGTVVGAGDTPKSRHFDSEKFVLDTMELLEQIEQPGMDATYSMSEDHKQMQCVMDLAEAEVELLAQQGDEEQFEHMLAELGKVNALNAEQLKMQKSLDSIKRRFHKDEEPSVQQELQPLQSQANQLDEVHHTTPTSQLLSSHSHSQSQSSSSGERLLSRRSRLYDDVNLSAMHDSNASGGSCNSTSFIVYRRDEESNNTSETCTPLQEEQEEQSQPKQSSMETEPSNYKLAERRERDRERFKTIKITKEMRARDEQFDNIVVPCIDDEHLEPEPTPECDPVQEQQRQPSPPGRLSRRDQIETSASNTNNYLTYKKPKEKSLLVRQLRPPMTELTTMESAQPRSLSRPRYISGLQKFTTVSKATSAGAGLNATTVGLSTGPHTDTAACPDNNELKSPMGTKSKSFHNLSSNISGMSAMMARPSLGAGNVFRRQPNKLATGMPQQEDGMNVFKVPKLVSGLRAPTGAVGAGAKRVMGNGIARPSSGYYSLSVKANAAESETPESLSSASSRGSLYGKEAKPNNSFDTQALSSKLTQVTIGASGIPKPSGLRPPTQMKRSGLPRPSSIVRR